MTPNPDFKDATTLHVSETVQNSLEFKGTPLFYV